FVCRVERGSEARIESPRARMRTLKYKATTHSVRCRLVQSLRDCVKKVRTTVISSPQNVKYAIFGTIHFVQE
ncbi:MAG: hypothetical protein WD509_01860, partial [Candidatus Paceibacterota bacterium]